MLSDKQVKKILKKYNLLSEKDFTENIKKAKDLKQNLERYILEKNVIDNNSWYEALARNFKFPFIKMSSKPIRKDILFIIPETIATTHKIVTFEKNNDQLMIATSNPDNLTIFEFIQKKTGLKLKINVASNKDIEEALKQYKKSLEDKFEDLSEDNKEKDENKNELQKLAHDLPIIRVVDTLLEYAIYQEASDIHIEPEEKDVIVRYRIDGILQTVMTLPKNTQTGIIARIKILANLKVDEHRLPQDGRFKIANKNSKFSFRVSLIPTMDGEKVVMRLLNEQAQVLNLELLGFQKKILELIKRNISKPHGIIFVTGPTGSGKTTTLYSILGALNSPTVNISTVEDPIEYRMEKVNQTQINPKIGLTFSIGLRALMRQDPDIIMVGEIRDEETAEIAMHAAMTGHLVLSTLHTNDAVSTIPRLSEMKVPNFLISGTTNLIIAQRLVRKICPNCIQSFNLDEESLRELDEKLNLEKLMKKMENEKIISDKQKNIKNLLFYKGKGCPKCNDNGFKGRVGVYEALEITENIAKMILKKASASEIKAEAEKEGMLTLLEDGFIKAINGVTTLDEIMRVTKE